MFKKIRSKKWFSLVTNLYILVGMGFLVWMVFLDANSLIIHYQLNTEIQTLEAQKMQLKKGNSGGQKSLRRTTRSGKVRKICPRKLLYEKRRGRDFFN